MDSQNSKLSPTQQIAGNKMRYTAAVLLPDVHTRFTVHRVIPNYICTDIAVPQLQYTVRRAKLSLHKHDGIWSTTPLILNLETRWR